MERVSKGQQECSVCAHPDRIGIETGMRSGTRYTALREAFGVSGAALSRHKAHMLDYAPSPARDKQLIAIDLQISALRRIQSRARRTKNGSELALKVSRELRSWFAMRVQFARSVQMLSTKRERSEPELSEEQLQAAAEVILRRKKTA